MLKNLSNLHVDFVASHIRYQIAKLQNILKAIEDEGAFGDEYVSRNLHDIEKNLRQLRRLYHNS